MTVTRSAIEVSDTASDNSIPFKVWIGPVARSECEQILRDQLTGADIQVLLSGEVELRGPATLVLHANDLSGPHRVELTHIANMALPGRPIVLGNGRAKDTLLDAINTWRAAQFITPETLRLTLVDGVKDAQRNLCLELSVSQKAEQLLDECRHLRSVTEELRFTQHRLVHTERLATVGRIVGTVLQRMREQFDYLEDLKRAQREVPKVGKLGDIFEAAVAGVDSFGALLEDMLALSENREAKVERQTVSLDALAERAFRLFRHDLLARRRVLEIVCDSHATVCIDPCRMIHVVLNLLRNAAQATAANERICLRTWSESTHGVIEVEDAGQGMDGDTLTKIFTPFFTTKGKAGMGLGLRLAKSTVEAYGGTIACTSSPGQGAKFKIRLPRGEG